MGKKKKHTTTYGGNGMPQWWQAKYMNDVYFRIYKTHLERIALARFKWHNVPDSIDVNYLEQLLLYDGSASIAALGGNKDMLYSLPYAQKGKPNAYNIPQKWKCINNYGVNYNASQLSGVIVYENISNRNINLDTAPTIQAIDMFAAELADLARTRQVNRWQQKTPWILKVPAELEDVAVNVLNQVAENEPAIIATQNYNELVNIELFNTTTPYLAELFNSDEKNVWTRAYQFLGIGNLPFKAERQVREEINSQQDPTDLSALGYLQARNMACAHLNELFGLNMFVTWANDITTSNFDYIFDLEHRAQIGEGEV